MESLVGKTILNRYRVEEFVGRGGMAEVYKVWDKNRAFHLAMKVLHADLSEDRIFLRRFEREAQTLEKLQHPTIVRYYGLEQKGTLAFMLMDYVEGESLRAEIFRRKGNPFSFTRTLEVMNPVCSALHYAHSLGMVHCDIKPSNILVKHNGEILVADFGISRMTDSSTMTMVGAGTPDYMAPEQILGKAPLPQTDVYALGIVLYEMLSGGERPFTGERAEQTGSTRERVLWEQLNLQPPRLTEWDDQVPKNIEAVVMKCLEKNSDNRYLSTLALINDLIGAGKETFVNELELDVEDAEISVPEVDENEALVHGRVADESTTPAPEPTTPMSEEFLPKLSSENIEKQFIPTKKSLSKIVGWVMVLVGLLIVAFAVWTTANLIGEANEPTNVSVQSSATTAIGNTKILTNTLEPTTISTPSETPIPTLTSLEPPSSNQISFSEDFSSQERFLTNWEQLGGIWSINDGVLSGSSFGGINNLGKILTGETYWANYTIEVEMNRLGDNRDSLIYFGYQNEESYYWIDVRTSGFDDVRLYDSKKEGALVVNPYENIFGIWYKIRVSILGNNVQVYIDDKLVLVHDLDENIEGKVGLGITTGQKGNSTILFDNFVVVENITQDN